MTAYWHGWCLLAVSPGSAGSSHRPVGRTRRKSRSVSVVSVEMYCLSICLSVCLLLLEIESMIKFLHVSFRNISYMSLRCCRSVKTSNCHIRCNARWLKRQKQTGRLWPRSVRHKVINHARKSSK